MHLNKLLAQIQEGGTANENLLTPPLIKHQEIHTREDIEQQPLPDLLLLKQL